MQQFPPQQYKVVKVNSLLDQTPQQDFQRLINTQYVEGWKLHSLVPQTDENGVYCNVAIFERK